MDQSSLTQETVGKGNLFTAPGTWLFTAILSLFIVLGSTFQAEASHFRHGSISWRVVSGNTIEFKISQAWRNGGNWSVGQQAYGDYLYFGDGQGQSFNVNIPSVNAADNWVYGETTFTHTYSSTGNYTAYFSGCCKIGGLSNNNGAYWRNETVVNLGAWNESPVQMNVYIMDLSGRVVEAYQNVQTESQIDFGRDLRQGLYLVRVQQGEFNKVIRVEKIH